MTTVNGMTAQRMSEIANNSIVDGVVVGTDLILTTQGGVNINAGPVKGTPGAPGGTDVAFQDWILDTTSNTYKALNTLLSPTHRDVGLNKNCVIIGSDQSLPRTNGWVELVCSRLGLTPRNFSTSFGKFEGTGFQAFLAQIQLARDNGAFTNDNVALVIISDISLSIQSYRDVGAVPADLKATMVTALALAVSTFPNARVVCLPVIWPPDPDEHLNGYPAGGYQEIWPYALTQVVHNSLLPACQETHVEFIDQSWTWLTGLTGIMGTIQSNGRFYPLDAGQNIIAEWVMSHLRGNNTRADSSWKDPEYLSWGITAGAFGMRQIKVRREGWTVFYEGAFKRSTFQPSDIVVYPVKFPIGFRPARTVQAQLTKDESVTHVPGVIYHDGHLQVNGGMTPGDIFYLSGSFQLY